MNLLVADDSVEMRDMFQDITSSWGYDCDVASNGAEAVELARKNSGKYDLSLLDFDMPILNGLEAAQKIRKISPFFPILMVTGSIIDEEKHMELGHIDGCLKKPFVTTDLKKKINELTLKTINIHKNNSHVNLQKGKPMNSEELQELKALKEKGLTKLKLVGTDYAFVVHRNIQNKISHDLIGMGKELSEFIDRNEAEPGRCHIYKANLHVTKDIFLPEELEREVTREDKYLSNFTTPVEKKLPE